MGAGAQPGVFCPSSSSPRPLHRDTILHLLPGPSPRRGGEDPGPFGESNGVLFSKQPVLRELQVMVVVGGAGATALREARI